MRLFDEDIEMQGRYEFSGTGCNLYRAMVLAQQYMSRGYVDVEAEDYIDYPEAYGIEGEWIERVVES